MKTLAELDIRMSEEHANQTAPEDRWQKHLSFMQTPLTWPLVFRAPSTQSSDVCKTMWKIKSIIKNQLQSSRGSGLEEMGGVWQLI